MHRALGPLQMGAAWSRFSRLAFDKRKHSGGVVPARPQPPPALTHHQILEMAAPYVRAGHQVDMSGSDRLQRRLSFHAVRHAPWHAPAVADDVPAEAAGVLETLQLESPRPGFFRLTRTVCDDEGRQAVLQAAGPAPGHLLAWVQAVPMQRHFHAGAGFCMVSSGCVVPADTGSRVADASHPPGVEFQATDIVVHTDELSLRVHVTPSGSADTTSSTFELLPRRPIGILPCDLLAVLGWDWSLLQRGSQGWRGSLRVRGAGAMRGRDAEHKLRVAARHLAQTVAEPPDHFHERQRHARWGVLARHAIPALAYAWLAVEALYAAELLALSDSPLMMALMGLPAALLLWFLLRSEPPLLRLPNWPRPLPVHAWTAPCPTH